MSLTHIIMTLVACFAAMWLTSTICMAIALWKGVKKGSRTLDRKNILSTAFGIFIILWAVVSLIWMAITVALWVIWVFMRNIALGAREGFLDAIDETQKEFKIGRYKPHTDDNRHRLVGAAPLE